MTEKTKLIDLSGPEFADLQSDISDLLCWIQGYDAGCRSSDSFAMGYPFDVESLRRLNILLKST